MRPNPFAIFAWVVLLVLSAPVRQTLAADKIDVVTTFSVLADMVGEVGGDRVQVHSLVGPASDSHVFQASPADAVTLKRARLVIENGLGFEGWLQRLVSASGYEGPRQVASQGIEPIFIGDQAAVGHGHQHGHGEGHHREDGNAQAEQLDNVDPHAWQSVSNAIVYVKNIADALCSIDAVGCEGYEANARVYSAELAALDSEIEARFSKIPLEQRKVITSHLAFEYFAKRYGVEIFAPEGVSTEQEAAALDVAALIRQIRKHDIKALFVENVSDPRLIEQIARETGLKPAGKLYSDALSKPGEGADSYIAMMRHNAGAIAGALENPAQ